jgi:hypothetical protein
MSERHTLFHRPTLTDTPKEVRDFGTYKAALLAGQQECGHGKFWVESERLKEGAKRWIEFAPPQPKFAAERAEVPILEFLD